MSSPRPQHKTLFVAPQAAGPLNAAPAPPPKVSREMVGRTTDVTRVRPAYVAAFCGAGGLIAAFVASGNAVGSSSSAYGGPGPLTPAHVKAKLSCEKCHGATEEGTELFKKKAKGACVGCHDAHPSTREPHRRLAADGKMGCTTCHTIHGPQSGVRFSDEGPAVRYTTWGESEVPDVAFHVSNRTVLVPTIPIKVCNGCHTSAATDPLMRCRSFAGGGELEPTVCFDEHRLALPPAPQDTNGRKPAPRRTDPVPDVLGPKRNQGACADQHFEDRSFAWEAAREVVAKAPPIARTQKGTSLAWFGGAAALAALGYVGTAATEFIARKRARKDHKKTAIPSQERKRLPVIDTSTCLGCYACVDACPYGVLEVERYVAVVARPDACCGLVLCEQSCPNGSLIVAEEGTLLERPRIDASLESTEVPGLFLAGDVTGTPLIKNAIAQGTRAADAVNKGLSSRPAKRDGAHDVCIVGAGPAGISAGLRLRELGVDAIVLEQGSVAQSVQNFPRGKLVFDQPLELPVEGKLWLKESSKEELLLHWMRIVRKQGLKVREQVRMSGVTRRPDGLFVVQGVEEEAQPIEVLARSVILAIGQRGSPRRLAAPIPPEIEPMVHYHLADARSLSGRRIIVAGLGDSAMEAAIALAHQPKTSVTIVARGATYARGQPRNIAELERLRKAKRLDIRFGVEIAEVHAGWLLTRPVAANVPPNVARSEQLAFDNLLVLIGSIPPWDTLRRAGISAQGGAHAEGLRPPQQQR